MFVRVVILAIAALVALPAVAGAADKYKVKQSPDEVRRYWTDERMKNAKPMRVDRAGKVRPGGASSWTSFEADLTGGVYKDPRHGKVFFSEGTSNYVCSGTVLTGSVVWTAGHCTVEGGGGSDTPYTNWLFVPAYRDGARPYGTFTAAALSFTADWDQDLEYGHDFAGATIARAINELSLETVIGEDGYKLAVDYDPEPRGTATTELGRMQSHGYPAEGKFNGQRQNVCSSDVIRRDMGSPRTMGINCDSNGGSSGGSWINRAGAVASVNSYGYGSLRNVMFGPAQDGEATAVYETALAAPTAPAR